MARSKVYGGIAVDIRGLEAVQSMLGQMDDPAVKKLLQQAMDAGGNALKPSVVREAPYPKLKAAVWVHRAKRRRPATVVGHHMKNKGWTWKFVAGGTRDHGPKNAPWLAFWSHGRYYVLPHVRGVKANPFVARAFAHGQTAAMAAVEKVVDDYLDSL